VKSDFGESLIFFVVWDEKREKGKIMNLRAPDLLPDEIVSSPI